MKFDKKRCIYCDVLISSKTKSLACISCQKQCKVDYAKKYKQRDYVKQKGREQIKFWRSKPKNKEKALAYSKEYRKRPEVIKRFKEFYLKNRDKPLYKERARINQRKYGSRPEIKERYSYRNMSKWHLNYQKKRRREDPAYDIRCRVASRFATALKRYGLGKLKKMSFYGISISEIVAKLGPCPGDRDEYHIDHIIPLWTFDLAKDEEIKRAFNPENLQWLPKKINQSKGGRYVKN